MLLTEGQMSDYKGAALMLDALPRAKAMLGDKGYDADWFRNALIKRGIVPCIPSKANRKLPIAHDQTLYRQRHKIENMFGKLKDWRRIHTRYDRCAHTFFSAICIAATIIFWINQGVLSLALLWQFGFDGVGDEFLAVGASLGWRPCEEVEDGLPDGRHARLWRRSPDSFFSVPLL
jgi:transposase